MFVNENKILIKGILRSVLMGLSTKTKHESWLANYFLLSVCSEVHA